jgi:hypothetical protein
MQHEAGNEGGMSSSERIMAAYEAGSKQELRLFWHSVARRCAALRITFGQPIMKRSLQRRGETKGRESKGFSGSEGGNSRGHPLKLERYRED